MLERAPLWVRAGAGVTRRLPFGRYRLTHAFGGVVRPLFKAHLAEDLGGLAFACDLNDAIAREACFTGRYEPQQTQLACAIAGPGAAVIDIGANWGYFTLVSAHRVGPSGRVLALEPHPEMHALLVRNVALNGLAWVTCREVAASDAVGEATLSTYPDDPNRGTSRVTEAPAGRAFTVRTRTVDQLMAEGGWPSADLVKIDVEGLEARVLRGMAAGLARGAYQFVLLECHPPYLQAQGISIEECLAPLLEANYQGWSIDSSPEAYRRTARRRVPTASLLRPLDPGTVGREAWPHLFWAAPGARVGF